MTLAIVVDICTANNDTWDKIREKKARLVKKLKKDFRKLKKQEGAVKLVGSENGGHEAFDKKSFEYSQTVFKIDHLKEQFFSNFKELGNVEILHDGKWGSVCDDEWDYLEANVVCRQLGFDGAIKPTANGHFGQARRRYWMDNVYCDGSEDELSKCRFDGWGASDCEGGEAAGVICARDQQQQEAEDGVRERSKARRKPEKRRIKDTHQQGVAIRLAGGRVHSEGRVEVKLGRSDWGVICGDGWSLFEAAVVCRQLGLGYASDAVQTNFFGGEKTPMAISGVQCRGNESSLTDCLHDKLLDCPGNFFFNSK
ncbi:Scavenger receptor cysteine-rich domain-containing group B protein [Apis cerana cerana]|uniref:Scavenger receptor cysteine-rich domain-containing group B protein n=1 Tax=Apis cerana cerana TaxID=94128 RepID=A0A2A3EEV8_APICC|nr:Scavenger receptor cysteine-rich domain-containing group B protein [Apis cerana cerana]